MTHREVIDAVARLIEKRVNEGHINRKSWNKTVGQWLVYGFESKLGFSGAVQLESMVENAYRNKTSIFDAAKIVIMAHYDSAKINLDEKAV